VDTNLKIYIAGHTGMVGSAITAKLKTSGYDNFILKSHRDLDLLNQRDVLEFFRTEKPHIVIIAAALVGGIQANNIFRGQFIYENLMIQSNIIHSAHEHNVQKLLFLGSACIYPKESIQPIKEEYLLTNYLEFTNEPYAIAKIAGIKMCENYFRQYGDNYISVMPNNLYGKNDNFNLETSHVLPALMRKFHEGKINNNDKVEIWGSGKPLREFLHVDDLADACVYLMQNLDAKNLYNDHIAHINIGSGEEISIIDLANLIKEIIGYKGGIYFNSDYPDGTPRKLLDVTRLDTLGWESKIKLEDGIKSVYKWFIKNV
jgi:GDP-L-fucose synthase